MPSAGALFAPAVSKNGLKVHMSVRNWYVSESLESFQKLTQYLNELTEEEVIAALELEAASRRRRSIVDRLISRAVRLRELEYVAILKEKYHGTQPVESDVGSGRQGSESCSESREG